MTEHMERLAGMASNVAPGAVRNGEAGFAIDAPDAVIEFFSAGGRSAAGYCRAKVIDLGGAEVSAAFAEAALRGNFFWRATNGAVLSLNEKEGAVYLTDRFDEGAFADEDSFADYVDGFMRTRLDWQLRLDAEFAAARKEAQQ